MALCERYERPVASVAEARDPWSRGRTRTRGFACKPIEKRGSAAKASEGILMDELFLLASGFSDAAYPGRTFICTHCTRQRWRHDGEGALRRARLSIPDTHMTL